MHDGPEGHYHDIGDPVGGHDDVVVWTTVGVDVGSSTSQIAFSRVTLERDDDRYVIASREMLHQSDVILTPYLEGEVIDGGALAKFIDEQYTAAGIAREQIDAGAVILTGLALETRNARAIADAIADDSGKFVAVSAGDLLEARLAASGAGVPNLSRERRGVVAHVDIGGGTTKLSMWRHGAPLGLAAIDVGARLVTYDHGRRITRVADAARSVLRQLNLPLRIGDILDTKTEDRIADAMARQVLANLFSTRSDAVDSELLRTSALPTKTASPDAILFSGGVSEYVYGRESRVFGDLGQSLGRSIRTAIEGIGVELLPFSGGIRATVLGASQHTMQLSGSTVFVSDPALLPLRNVPVVIARVELGAGEIDRAKFESALDEAFGMRDDRSKPKQLAVAISWRGSATYKRLNGVAAALIAAAARYLPNAAPLVVITDGDVAGVLGSHLSDELDGRRGVICLDAIHVHEFDHIDIGQYAARTKALPVIVKSLLFAAPHHQGSHHVGH
jgi:ethanolamine utilization protein EutA